MESRTFPLTEFALADFIAAYTDFYQWWSGADEDGSVAVYLAEAFGEPPTPSNEAKDLEAELIGQGMLVFFPFHEPITSDQVKCLDGGIYVEDESPLEIGEADAYGFLVQVSGGDIIVHPALHDGSSGPAPTLNIEHRCGALDERMNAYLGRFVRRT